MQTILQRLYKLRKDKKLSRDNLGIKVGVSKTAIKNWEDNENVPKLECLQLLSNYFDCNVEYLTQGIIPNENIPLIAMDKLYYLPVLGIMEAAKFFINATDIIVNIYVPMLGDDYNQFNYWLGLEDESMYPTLKN